MAPFIFLKSFLEGKEITLFNEGKSRRDFTYVGDIVEGVVKVIEGPDQSAKLCLLMCLTSVMDPLWACLILCTP